MQEYRENEKNTGTREIRVATIAGESMNVNKDERKRLYQQDYKAVTEFILLDAETFTHPVTAYQTLVVQGNEEAKRILNLVHIQLNIHPKSK